MTHNGIIYKISGGFDNPEVAKELAFIEGIRRINFLFGRKGRESEGALHQHQLRVAGEADLLMSREMIWV
jgi:hypothetical protein